MQPTADFRTRVRAVRLESKSFLQAVRAERLARSRDASAGPSRAPNNSETAVIERLDASAAQEPDVETSRGTPDIQPLTVSAHAARVSRLAQASAPRESEPATASMAVFGISEEPAEAPATGPDIDVSLPSEEMATSTDAAEAAQTEEGFGGPESAEDDDHPGLEQSREAEPYVEATSADEADSELPTSDEAVQAAATAGSEVAPVIHLHRRSAGEADASDLGELPGAGPGLIWMLQKLGIHSQTDLARADAEDLGVQLGVIGQLLDLRGWIACARQNVGGVKGPA